MIRTCSICGKEFESSQGWICDRKYCSKECGNTARRIKYYEERKNRICKQCGKPFVYSADTGSAWFCSIECRKRWNYEQSRLRKIRKEAESRCVEWLQNGVPDNFTVLSDWKEYDGNVEIEIRCNDCGETFTKPIYFARRTVHCPLCWERKRKRVKDYHPRKYGNMDDYKAVLEAKKQETLEQKEKEREARKQVKICKFCGKEFETYRQKQVCCSPQCSDNYKKEKWRMKENRVNETNLVDKDITLMRLFKRDNGTCWICGGKCNYSDFSIGADGFKKCGENYPSIDHVIPLARGGMHAWKNVALAHLKCNILKSDSIPDLGITFDYPEIRGKHSRKTVFQFDLNDNLVNVYESTSEAEKSTGIKQRGIQNCARGETKTYKGYKWKYDECERNKAS